MATFVGSQFFYPVALSEYASNSAGFLHHQLLAATTLLVLVSIFRRRILHLSNRKSAV
jgi:hypothetical protein